jgi:hypothetical protein
MSRGMRIEHGMLIGATLGMLLWYVIIVVLW